MFCSRVRGTLALWEHGAVSISPHGGPVERRGGRTRSDDGHGSETDGSFSGRGLRSAEGGYQALYRLTKLLQFMERPAVGGSAVV